MNAETVNLIERPYQEIVDDILTAIVGGVVNEPIFFDVKEDRYALAQRAADVRGITGTVKADGPDGEPMLLRHAFQKSVDFAFSATDNAVIWQDGAIHPEDETLFYVDYFRPPNESRSPLSDINVGSVTRTLGEAIGREIATVYQQINQAYLSGFVDTAHGQALDLVVSILGIKRIPKDFAIGQVTFFRDPQAGDGAITIPEGTTLTTEKAEASFVTTQLRTLQRGQARIDVPVRASGASKGPAGVVESGKITTMAQPITGIARVSNLDATFLGAEGESDDELRARAKAVLRGIGKGTLAAILNAVAENRGKVVPPVFDAQTPTGQSTPGRISLLIDCKPERFFGIRDAVEQTRAAGVVATVAAKFVFFKPRMVVQAKRNLTPAGKVKLLGETISELTKFVNGLGAGKPVVAAELLKALEKVKDLDQAEGKKPRIVGVTVQVSDLSGRNLDAEVEALFQLIRSVPADDDQALKTALKRSLDEPPALTADDGRRADRSLIQSAASGRSGQPATDAEIETAQFQVVTPGADFTIVLDLDQTDIVLQQAS
jgi:hypothetical protein